MYEVLAEEISEGKGKRVKEGEEEGEEPAEKIPIMADLSHTGAAVKAVLVSPGAIEDKSAESLEDSMRAIRQISGKIMDTVEGLKARDRPSELRVNFGLKFTAEGRAVITKAEKETNLKVSLSWKPEK